LRRVDLQPTRSARRPWLRASSPVSTPPCCASEPVTMQSSAKSYGATERTERGEISLVRRARQRRSHHLTGELDNTRWASSTEARRRAPGHRRCWSARTPRRARRTGSDDGARQALVGHENNSSNMRASTPSSRWAHCRDVCNGEQADCAGSRDRPPAQRTARWSPGPTGRDAQP
jgi:hypothetical protein